VVHTEIQIDAPPAAVWAVLTDFAAHAAWIPFLVAVEGEARQGARLHVTLAPPEGRRISMRPTITEVEPGRVLEWWGHLGVRGIFDGRHRFELHPTGSGTHLVQEETFTGVLVPFLARMIDGPTAAGFALMNNALRDRAEAQHAGRQA
jgi:hypothetical protein